MSILSITHEDTVREGRDLPEGIYRVLVEQAEVQPPLSEGGGTRLFRQYGNIRTRDGSTEFALPNGATFRIGGRKLFARSWIDHPNAEATKYGNGEIKREVLAAGLVAPPAKGEKVDLPFESFEELASTLVGCEELVRVRHRVQREKRVGGKEGEIIRDEAGQPKISVEVADWLMP